MVGIVLLRHQGLKAGPYAEHATELADVGYVLLVKAYRILIHLQERPTLALDARCETFSHPLYGLLPFVSGPGGFLGQYGIIRRRSPGLRSATSQPDGA